ncbi:MAG: ribbon-helix-helix protein, CopG family [Chloroflexi bacterium]|nr:ribbon-helix-helix protein, CopG family [Chloroflexota bacterium]
MQNETYPGANLFTAHLGEDTKAQLKAFAAERGVTMSAVVREAVGVFLGGDAPPTSICSLCEGTAERPPVINLDDDAFGHWLAGFIDGEASFKINQIRRSVTYRCALTLTLRDDDTDILQEIQRRLGIGSLTHHVNARIAAAANPVVVWSVHNKGDCMALVNLLDRYPLRAKKARDYELWREAVVLWHGFRGTRWHPEAGPWVRIAELRDQLVEGRRYVARAA